MPPQPPSQASTVTLPAVVVVRTLAQTDNPQHAPPPRETGIRPHMMELTPLPVKSAAALLRRRPTEPCEQSRGHGGGSTPDVARRRSFDGERRHHVVAAVARPRDPSESLRGHELFEGDREDSLHLVRIKDHLCLRGKESDERAHAEVGGRYVQLLQLSHDIDQIPSEVYLFPASRRAVSSREPSPGSMLPPGKEI